MPVNIYEFMRKTTISNLNQANKIFKKIMKLAYKKCNEETIYAIIIDSNKIVDRINLDYIDYVIENEPEKIFNIYDITLNVILLFVNLYEDLKSNNYSKKVKYEDYMEYINNNCQNVK